MTLAHFHLAAVHLPIVAMPLLLLILLAGLQLKKPDLSNTALVGIAVVALVTIPIFLTGEAAEELVEHLPTISEDQVELHEFAATVAFVMVSLSGLLSLIGIVATKFQYSWARTAVLSTVFVSTVCSATLAWAANEGGKIRHLEIIDPTVAAAQIDHLEHGEEYEHDDH